jgi:signal transduction histidine kinase
VVVAVSLVPYRHTRHIALVGTAILSLVLLAAAVVAVRWALGAALRPVAEMTEHAADWSEHDLHRRFDLGEPNDELTSLAATFDGLLRRIESVVRHEQRFSAEMAHELRTPLAGLRADAELERGRADLPASTREALERMVAATVRMETVIETLLSSARMTNDAPTASCDPVGALRQAVVALSGAAESRNIRIRLGEPAEPLTVDAAPEVVTQAVYPLLENGVRHAASRVEIGLSRRDGEVTISVADDGSGLTADRAEDVFAPGVSSTGGAGLGLPLARRLARSCGGDVLAAPAAAGTRFELRLPGGGRAS